MQNKTRHFAPWLIAAVLAVCAGAGPGWWKASRGTDAAAGASARPGGAQGGAQGGGGGRRFAGANPVQPVSVESVRRQDIRVSVSAIGSMAASNTAVVRTQVGGVLQGLNFKEGQQVRAGQWLAQIDPRSFQAALGQAEGTLARDKAQLEGARIDLARYRELLAKDAIPRQQLDTQLALVAQLEGTLMADQGTVDNARLQLSYTRVVAPIPGRAGLKQIDLGNVANPSDANGIVSITQTHPIAMVFAVPSANVPYITSKLRANLALPVQAWDRGGRRQLAEGRVAAVDNAIDPSTDTIKVKALFANADDALFPNQAVSVTLQLDTLVATLTVPQAAVLRGAQGFYVYVVNADSTVATRVVKPGAVDAGWMAVEGPLQPGERVVVDGSDRLREGARVEVIAADPAQRAGASAAAGSGRRGGRAASSAMGSAAAPGTAAMPASAPLPEAGATSAATSARDTPNARKPEAAVGAERPRWMDRLKPEQAAKVQAMSPDERRAWFKAQREARDSDAAR
jgi:multidrug efflux system membrane fusion protein